MTITVHRIDTPEQMAQAWQIRREVFIAEQGVSEAEELDGRDDAPTTHHVLALDEHGSAVGTARMIIDGPGLVHVGRVAVLATLRGSGVGAALMHALERLALDEAADSQGQVRVELSAQVSALEFYRRLGYDISPEKYLDARIWHQDAHKTLVV